MRAHNITARLFQVRIPISAPLAQEVSSVEIVAARGDESQAVLQVRVASRHGGGWEQQASSAQQLQL